MYLCALCSCHFAQPLNKQFHWYNCLCEWFQVPLSFIPFPDPHNWHKNSSTHLLSTLHNHQSFRDSCPWAQCAPVLMVGPWGPMSYGQIPMCFGTKEHHWFSWFSVMAKTTASRSTPLCVCHAWQPPYQHYHSQVLWLTNTTSHVGYTQLPID